MPPLPYFLLLNVLEGDSHAPLLYRRAAILLTASPAAHRISWVVTVLTKGQRYASAGKIIGDRACVRNRTGESVQLRHNQRVAFAHGGQSLI